MNFQKTILLLLITSFSLSVSARIKLVTLPDRELTQVKLENPVATLVEEQRTLTLQKGINKVDFSWKGVHIHPDSIRLSIIGKASKSKLLNVSYPPNSQALVWEIFSPEAKRETIKISYLLENIDRVITYEARATQKEDALDLSSFMVLRNFSGESFDAAEFTLTAQQAFNKAIKNGETKRILYQMNEGISFEKMFVFDAGTLPWEPDKLNTDVGIPVYYEFDNSDRNKLGKYGLWAGKVRVFQNDGQQSSIFLGEDNAGFTPVDQTMKVYVGDSRDLVITQRKKSQKKLNLRRNNHNKIVLYDSAESMEIEVENFKNSPARLRINEPMQGEWSIRKSTHPYKRKDAKQFEFEITIPAKQKIHIEYDYVINNIRG